MKTPHGWTDRFTLEYCYEQITVLQAQVADLQRQVADLEARKANKAGRKPTAGRQQSPIE